MMNIVTDTRSASVTITFVVMPMARSQRRCELVRLLGLKKVRYTCLLCRDMSISSVDWGELTAPTALFYTLYIINNEVSIDYGEKY